MKQCPQVGMRNTLLSKGFHVFVLFFFFFCKGPNNRYFRLWDNTLCCDCSALPGCTKAATDKWAGCVLIKFSLHKPVACGFPAVSALFLAYSFLMESLCTLVKNQLAINVWVYSELSILFHWSVYLCLCQHHYFDYSNFGIRKYESSSFFFFNITLAIQSPCSSLWIWGSAFPFP